LEFGLLIGSFQDRRGITPGPPLPNGAKAKTKKREEANEIEDLVADLGYMWVYISIARFKANWGVGDRLMAHGGFII